MYSGNYVKKYKNKKNKYLFTTTQELGEKKKGKLCIGNVVFYILYFI